MTELVGTVSLYEENQAPSSPENVGYVSLLWEPVGEVTLAKPFGIPETRRVSTGDGGASQLRYDRIVVTAEHIFEKQFSLTYIPVNPSTVMFLPQGGIAQFLGEDFVIDDNILSWNELGLDGFIEENDIIHVYYT